MTVLTLAEVSPAAAFQVLVPAAPSVMRAHEGSVRTLVVFALPIPSASAACFKCGDTRHRASECRFSSCFLCGGTHHQRVCARKEGRSQEAGGSSFRSQEARGSSFRGRSPEPRGSSHYSVRTPSPARV